MFKLTYNTDEGMVEATFKTAKEMDAFRSSLQKKAADRARRLEAKKAAEFKKLESEKEAMANDLKKRTDEIRSELEKTLLKAKEYRLTPEYVVELITETLNGLADKD